MTLTEFSSAKQEHKMLIYLSTLIAVSLLQNIPGDKVTIKIWTS